MPATNVTYLISHGQSCDECFEEKVQNAPLVLLTDPFHSTYNVLVSGQIYKVEFIVGNSSYFQLFVKP